MIDQNVESPVKISVVIRTLNEEQHLGTVIEALRAQRLHGPELDIVVVDSGSEDGTLNIARKWGAHIIEMRPEEFSYSAALNMGIEKSHGELIVIVSGHAVPCSSDWLEKLTGHFDDSRVAGVYCRQVPWPDAPWHEIERLERQFPDVSRRFSAGGPMDGMHFSNAASCIRRSFWSQQPFAAVAAAEDRRWAEWAIDGGYDIIYEGGAVAWHSHSESPEGVARRRITIERAADARLCRKRTLVLTLRQGLGWLVGDSRRILRTRHCRGKRMRYLMQTVKCVFWYVVRFRAVELTEMSK
jgi:rhamnosyltransferase